MQRDDTIRTLHILEAARKALHFVENRRRDAHKEAGGSNNKAENKM